MQAKRLKQDKCIQAEGTFFGDNARVFFRFTQKGIYGIFRTVSKNICADTFQSFSLDEILGN